jgi:transcriptional regulator with XRE-family HTH domain
MNAQNQLGVFLRSRRKSLGKTLADVSRASGVDVTSISDYERGAKQPTSGRLIAVCDALGIDILKELRGE